MRPPLILASASPRRSELLRQIGLSFTISPADVDEIALPGEAAEAYAVRVAVDKARAAAGRAGKGIVIAADTIVVLGDSVLGKPKDNSDAARMLGLLSGNEHRVITGLVVMDAQSGKTVARAATTMVKFRSLSEDEINRYVAAGEPLDKAGAYGIQGKGALLVERINGCYFNVVGLPLTLLAEALREFNVSLL